jgi:hypothetical protein
MAMSRRPREMAGPAVISPSFGSAADPFGVDVVIMSLDSSHRNAVWCRRSGLEKIVLNTLWYCQWGGAKMLASVS